MVEVHDWQQADDPDAVLRSAVRALGGGRLVAFPTETGYGLAAGALESEAFEHLAGCLPQSENHPLTLALRAPDDILDWVPGVSSLGRRLARRCWPGPVELAWSQGIDVGLAGRLPENVRRRLCANGALGFCSPAHDAILLALRRLSAPLVFAHVDGNGSPGAMSEKLLQAGGERLAMIIDDGPSRYDQPATAVHVDGDAWKIVREGVVSREHLEKLACQVILFVCTGNTCRSPLAEALCKKLLAERLGCSPEELPRHGFFVQSAGLSAMIGMRATAEAEETARELGGDLSNHSSRPVTEDLLAGADHVVAMTRSHLRALAGLYPRLGPCPRLLCPDGEDVPDPIGCDGSVYRECAQQILLRLEQLAPEVLKP